MIQGLTLDPFISQALWLALAVPAAALLAWYGWKRSGALSRVRWITILSLMATGMAAVLLILLNPTWVKPIPPPAGKPLLTILVDASASMETDDIDEGVTRFQSAVGIADAMSENLQSRFEVRICKFSASVTPVEPAELSAMLPDGQATDLAGAITSSLEEARPQGQALFLLSDGIHNGPGGVTSLFDVLRTTKAMGIPVYTKTLGGDAFLKDLEITLGRPQELAFAGQNVPISVMLRQRGQLTDIARVDLMEDGKKIDGREVQIAADDSATVRFDVKRDTAGLYPYEVRVETHSQEATTGNNSASLLLRVVQEPIRVLLLEGKPYWDGKFLMRTLASDPSLELDALVRLSESRFMLRSLRLSHADVGEGNGSPNAEDTADSQGSIRRSESTQILSDPRSVLDDPTSLEKFQIVVLGRDSESFLSGEFIERLKTWISRDGGSLVCYRGSPVAKVDQVLGRLMPVRWSPTRESRFRMSMTERGESLNWLVPTAGGGESVLDKLPSLVTHAQPERPKPLAVVLARSDKTSESPPVVTYQSYGTGRVVAIEGSGMWRWAFLAPQFQKHDDIYGSLWQSLLRWLVSSVGLVPGRDIVLRSEKVRFTTEESVHALLLMREEASADEIPNVDLTDSTGKIINTFKPVPLGDEPGVYRVNFGRLPEGRYRSTVLYGSTNGEQPSNSIAFDVRQQFREQIEVDARPDIMARISSQTGGTVIEDPDPRQIVRQFQEHISRSRPQRVVRISAWDRWWVLLGVFVIWGTTWGLRRSGGLV